MADRLPFHTLALPRPASVTTPEVKAYPDTGVTFIGPNGTGDLIYLMGQGNPYATEQLTRQMAFAVSAYCFTAMNWRASRMAQAPLMIVRETSDGEEWQPDHPLVPLLDQPRPDLQMGELLERTQMYRDLTGGALWVTDQDAVGRRAIVTPFSVDEFRSVADGALIYGRYEVRTGNGGWKGVTLDQIVHFRETNPASWRDPVSRVDVALLQLDLGHNVNRIVHSFLRKAMFPGGIISPDPKWAPMPAEWTAWKAMVAQWYAGPANQGAPLAVPGGTTITKVNAGMKDLLPEDILDRVEATIGAVFGVAPVILGWLSGMKNSPWSQMSEARRQTYEDTIEPLWGDYERRLTMAWLTPEERAGRLLVRFDTHQIPALKNDNEQQARIAALTSDILTRNERRILVGQDPLPDDDPRGEEIVGSGNQGAPGSVGVGDPAQDPTADPATDPAPDPNADPPPDLGKGQKAGADTKDLLWLIFDLDCKAAEGVWSAAIYAHLQGLKREILSAARDALATPKKADGPLPTDGREFQLILEGILDADRPRLAAKTYPLLISTGTTAVKRISARLGLSFTVLEPGLINYAKEESVFLARVMGEATGKSVAAAVQAGLDAGDNLRSLMKRLEQLPAFDRDRAKMVARTETTRAWNGAQRRSMSDYQARTGKSATKSWLSSRDSRVREEHQALDDGSFIAIDATFGNGLTEPGEPNCRCTLLYGFAEDSSEE